jgi:DegV family protein with EDD domain
MVAVMRPRLFPAEPRITAAALRRALIAGMRRVISRRDLLNRINVFPVPDGDTGSNLAFTLSSVLSGSLSRRAGSPGALLRAVAEDAIDGARGNSGAILAQFLHGVSEVVADAKVLTPQTIAVAARAGAEQAHGALAEPREGTIISVIRAFAEALGTSVGSARGDLRQWFGSALRQAQQALADTPNQLAVLRQAGVVDAGAQGFVDLLEGIDDFISSGSGGNLLDLDGESAEAEFAGEHWHEEADATRPWCSECLLQPGAASDGSVRVALQAALASLGAGSVVVAGGQQRMRIHAHVDDPSRLFEVVSRFGEVSGRKAEDMRVQHRAANSRQAVGVITDSGADLPRELAERLGIHSVPVRVSFGDEDFLDKVSLSPAEFYRRLKSSSVLPLTSQPPPGDFRRQFEFLLSHHQSVVYVGISRALSGTLQSGETAATRADAARVGVVDSGNASCGQGLLAIAAAEAAMAGADAAAVRAVVERLRPLTLTFAATRDVSFAVRGGRIPAWTLPVANALRLTAVAQMQPSGKLGVRGALFGRGNVPRRLAAYVARRVDRDLRWRLLVGHCDCATDGEVLLAALQQQLRIRDAWLVEAGPAIGAHAGPGALVVSLQAE